MIETRFFSRISIVIIVVSLFFTLLDYFDLPYQFYIWEFFIDLKPLTLFASILFFIRQKRISFSIDDLKIFRWKWKNIGVSIVFPVVLLFIAIGMGLLLGEVTSNKVDNKSTLILGAVFDLPAIFVFSTVTVLVEEIVFRFLVYSFIKNQSSFIVSILLTNILWGIYNISVIVDFNSFEIGKALILFFYFLSLGMACSVFFLWQNSIWMSYSFRIGMTILGPFLLNSLLVETDPFYVTGSFFFFANGLVMTVLLFIFALFGAKRIEKRIIFEV
jgi:membrane protease YdiL (CAAX protease family)